MQGIPNNSPAVIILQRDDGLCAVLDTREPHRNLMHVCAMWNIDKREALATLHHQTIAWHLREWLTTRKAGMPWCMVDFQDLAAQMAMFDPATGRRLQLADLKIGDPVAVAGAGRGKVVSIRADGRYQVDLDAPKGDLIGVDAPRSLLKPVLRPVPA